MSGKSDRWKVFFRISESIRSEWEKDILRIPEQR